MCGIAGFIERDERSTTPLEETAWKMIAPLEHRGPDTGDVWVDADARVGIGHRRLSIIDLSSAGAQPMVSASGRFVISYNGEIYNTGELRTELEGRGIRFRGHSDTEVVLEACAAWGIQSAAQRLNGMFAFAVWDRVDRSLFLVRDRIGIKPLYYCANSKGFSFASELRGLRAHPELTFSIDPDAVEAFLALDYIPAPFSIFREVKKLEPGTILRVDGTSPGRVRRAPYWTLHDAARKGHADRYTGTFEEATEELDCLLADAVGRRMVSDVPLGAFLSGGIDSSTVVALMQQQATRSIQTFSIGFSEDAFDEAPYAKAIAEHLGTDHCEHYVGPEEIREHGPAIMGHHDEPFADRSLLPTLLLSRLARSQVTVALSGDGGDEVFGGYARHVSADKLPKHPALKYNPLAKALFSRSIPIIPRCLRTKVQGVLGIDKDTPTPFSGKELGILARGLVRGIDDPALFHQHLAFGDIGLSHGKVVGPKLPTNLVNSWLQQTEFLFAVERQQYIDTAGYLPDDILTKVDRASMAVSLEVRVPILDHRIVEFSYRLPPAMKTDALDTKRILKRVLGRRIPESLFKRPKRGFEGPLASWLKGPLREWTAELMCRDSVSKHNVIDPRVARSISRRLRIGKIRQRDFRVIALAAWCETPL